MSFFKLGKKKKTATDLAGSGNASFDTIIDGVSFSITGSMGIGGTTVMITNSTVTGAEGSSIAGGKGSSLIVGGKEDTSLTSVNIDSIDVDVLIVRQQLFAKSIKCNCLIVESASAIPALLQCEGPIIYDTLYVSATGKIDGLLKPMFMDDFEKGTDVAA